MGRVTLSLYCLLPGRPELSLVAEAKLIRLQLLLRMLFIVSGALVAADLRLKRGTVAAIAIALGFCDGYLNSIELPTDQLRLPESCRRRRHHLRCGGHGGRICDLVKATVDGNEVRVVGSWISATGLLLLGWSLHSGRL